MECVRLHAAKIQRFFDFATFSSKKSEKTLAENEIVRIFAVSFRGIRRKDDNLYDLNGRYEPQIRSNGQKVGWIVGKKALMDKKWGKKAVVRLVKRLSDSSLL